MTRIELKAIEARVNEASPHPHTYSARIVNRDVPVLIAQIVAMNEALNLMLKNWYRTCDYKEKCGCTDCIFKRAAHEKGACSKCAAKNAAQAAVLAESDIETTEKPI